MIADDIDSRIEHLGDEIEKLSTQCVDDATRKKLFDVVSHAAAKLEPPFQTVWRMLLSVGHDRRPSNMRDTKVIGC